MPDEVKSKIDDKPFIKIEAMICSMTPKERANPDIIKGPRKVRIAKGAGVDVHDVNVLMTQFKQMQKMVKKLSGGGFRSLLDLSRTSPGWSGADLLRLRTSMKPGHQSRVFY